MNNKKLAVISHLSIQIRGRERERERETYDGEIERITAREFLFIGSHTDHLPLCPQTMS